MRTVTLVLALLLAVPVCFALDITTRKGVTYRQATVTKVEPDGVRISHADGAAKILFEDLPDALQRQYNYDPAKVAAYRKQLADAQEAAADKAAEEQRQRQEASDRAATLAREQAAEQARQEEARRAAARHAEEERIAAEARRKAREDAIQFALIAAGIIFGLFIYFLPSYVGRRKRNAGAIFVMNLFLGWIFIGWVIALIWACTRDSSMETLADQHLNNPPRRGRDPYPDRLPRGGGRGPYLE